MGANRAMNRNGRWIAGALTAATALGSSVPARAQGRSDPAAARALFMDARQLMADKKPELACPKFEESQRLDPGIGTLFNLADCWERIGRTASAWTRFLDVAATARSAGQADRERVARERASKLEPKLSKVTIQVLAPASGERVSKDGVEIGAAEWGTAVPTDPGEHVVEATAPGKKAWRSTAKLAAAGKIVVSVPALEDEPVVEATPLAAPNPAPKARPTEVAPAPADVALGGDRAESSSVGSTQRVLGYVIGGLGVGGLAVGTVFALQSNSKNNEALAICKTDPNHCPAEDTARHETLVSQTKDAQTMSIIGFAAGGAALATGLLLILTAPRGGATSDVRVLPLVGPTERGVALAGIF